MSQRFLSKIVVPRLGCKLEKMTSMRKNTSRVEIIITISIENCTKNMSKIFVALYSIYVVSLYLLAHG